MKTITEPAREIPVSHETQVLIAGGGVGGTIAAIAAARNGADTRIVERYGFLGGTATMVLMLSMNGFRSQSSPNELQAVKGIAQELIDELRAHGGAEEDEEEVSPYNVCFDPEVLKYVLLKMTQEAGVKLLLHTYISDAIVEDGVLKGIIVENKSGRSAILSQVTVDASGDGDVAARAGVPFEVGRRKDGEGISMKLMYRLGGLPSDRFHPQWGHIHGPQAPGLSGIDAEDLTAAEIKVREEVMRQIEERRVKDPNAYLLETGVQIGVRETRRMQGEYTLTTDDVLEGNRFDDVIAIGANPVAAHGIRRPHLAHEGFDIPYRCLVPRSIDNLLLSGRSISMSHLALGSVRAMATVMAIGQASGTAAALCIQDNVNPRHLDISQLQRTLIEQKTELRLDP